MRQIILRLALASAVIASTSACPRDLPIAPAAPPRPATSAPAPAASPQPKPSAATTEPESTPLQSQPQPPESSGAQIPLFHRFPTLAAKLPYRSLGPLPTPIEKADALGKAIGVANLYIKRDDLSGALYGGNKTRKLEFFLADALAAHKKTVVTSGAAGSNHALATAIYAKELGLRAILLLMPQPNSPLVRRNLLADQAAGAELRLVPTQKQIAKMEQSLIKTSEPGEEPYVIDAGGSSPLGNVGYVNAAFELADQVAAGQIPEPDRIYVAMGTMGCAVGLRLGLMAAGLHTKLIPVRASTWEAASDAKMIEMFNKTNEFIRNLDPSFPKLEIKPGETWIESGYLGGGYTVPTPKGEKAIRLFKENTGLDLEPTYTGKTLAALIDDAPEIADKVVVLWNSYNSRPLSFKGARVSDLPPAFREYFKSPAAAAELSALGIE